MVDADDSANWMRDLSALHGVDRGCVVCHTRPGIRSTTDLAEDIMVALGKSWKAVHAVPSAERWRLAETWLRAEKTAHLIILRGHLLAPVAWASLARMARRSQLTVWIVIHQPRLRPSHSRTLRRHRGVDVRRALDELRRRLPATAPERPCPAWLGAESVTAIRRLASPAHAALLTIALAGQAKPEQLAQLHRLDFSPSGSDVRIPGRSVSIPPSAQGAVRALILATRGWFSLVWLTPQGMPMAPPQLAAMLRAAAHQAEAVLPPEFLAAWEGSGVRRHVVRLLPDARTSGLIRQATETYLASIPKDAATDISLRIY